jgi:hypothetical protein
MMVKPITILLVEGNEGDAELARVALQGSKMNNRLDVVDARPNDITKRPQAIMPS